jgi:hypothetical protein
MAESENIAAQEAAQDKKMIEIKIRFWTNDIADEKGKLVPKHAWSSGTVRIERNKRHGIKPGKAQLFHSLLDVGSAVEKVLLEQGIVLHPSKRMRKYVQDKP